MDALMMCGTKQEEEVVANGAAGKVLTSENAPLLFHAVQSRKVGPKLPLPLHRFPRFKIALSRSFSLCSIPALNLCLPRFHSAKKSPLSFEQGALRGAGDFVAVRRVQFPNR